MAKKNEEIGIDEEIKRISVKLMLISLNLEEHLIIGLKI